jgi:Protein of unknown function (DUF2793)
MSDTPLLALPLIEASQAQKHVTHNEALLALDGSVHLAVISRSLSAPPALPADGDRYLVAASATGEWLGHSGHIASRQGASWRFATPKPGWRLWVQSEELFLLFDGVAWRDLLAFDVLQNVGLLGVNTTADAANKLAVASAGLLFTHVGNDTRVKINKNAVGDTASLLFQTGFSGRAEFGLAGDDNFHVKVSPDGSAWTEAMVIDKTTGAVSLANNSIGNAALADVGAATLKGRVTAGNGDPQDLTGTQATTLLDVFTSGLKGLVPASGGGTTNFLRADGTFAVPAGGGGISDGDKGDISVAGGGLAWTIDADVVTNAKLADMATATFKGRQAAGTGDPQDLTGAQATTLLDVFTSGLKGLVPASGGGTTNFLRADGTFAAPAGGGGSPGGSSGEVQYNNAGAFAGAADVEIETGQLRLPAIATPSAPAASGLKAYGKSVAGRVMAALLAPFNTEAALQPFIARRAISSWVPAGNSTTITADGDAALTPTGTATTTNVATTNRHTYMKRLEYLVTVAATTAVAGFRAAAAKWGIGGIAAGDGGFHLICRWGPATGVGTATARAFVGMANSTAAPTDVEPSSITNIVGMGWDAADANIQIMHRGAGAVTKIDLGASFPVPAADRTKAYELALFSKPGTTQEVGYEVTDLATGAVASGTITTNMPSTATLLAPRGWMSVGGTSSVIGIALMGLYVESDY